MISTSVLNALAAIHVWGDMLPHTHVNTRIKAHPFADYVDLTEAALVGREPLRFQELNAAGRAVVEKAPLLKCHDYLTTLGFRRNLRHNAKPGYVPYIRWAEGAERPETACIRSGRHVLIGWEAVFSA